MLRRRTIVALAAALAALTAVPAAAQAQYGAAFQTPSRNIACTTDGRTLACDVHNQDTTVVLDAYAYPELFFSDHTLYGFRTLWYGTSIRRGAFVCTSRSFALTCRSRYSGHGFQANRDRIRTW